MAKLTAVYGPMFAGKTTWILNKIEELHKSGEKCLVFKPRLDDRYGSEAKLHAHSGSKGEAFLVDETDPEQMLRVWADQHEQHSVVVIDEAMFFAPKIVAVVKEMLARELQVIVAGLDTNFKREPFGSMPHLIKLADEHEKLTAKCYKCGKVAEYSARLQGGVGLHVVGATDKYQPTCARCHTILGELDSEVVYPYLRTDERDTHSIRIEVMADSMRVGKTTAVEVIAEGLQKLGKSVTVSYEDWRHNPYLKKSYSDPAKNFLESQKWFIKRKWEQIRDGATTEVFIQDVAPEMDFCYAATNLRLGRMSREHFFQYDQFYRSLDWKQAPSPQLLVYLAVSDGELIKRAEASRREFETVEPEYFLMMKKVNREWLTGAQGNKEYRILKIDTDKLDFAHDEAARGELLKRVKNALDIV